MCGAHAYNPSTWMQSQEDNHKIQGYSGLDSIFQASQSYTVRVPVSTSKWRTALRVKVQHVQGPGFDDPASERWWEEGKTLNLEIGERTLLAFPLPLPRKHTNPQLTYQVSDPIPQVVHEREDKHKLRCVDDCWTQRQGLHKHQIRLKAPRKQQRRQAKKRNP